MLNLVHAASICPNFTFNGEKEEVTVIIGPIRIFEDLKENGIKAYDLVIGCNFYHDCEQAHCGYSWIARQERKKEKGQVQ